MSLSDFILFIEWINYFRSLHFLSCGAACVFLCVFEHTHFSNQKKWKEKKKKNEFVSPKFAKYKNTSEIERERNKEE